MKKAQEFSSAVSRILEAYCHISQNETKKIKEVNSCKIMYCIYCI